MNHSSYRPLSSRKTSLTSLLALALLAGCATAPVTDDTNPEVTKRTGPRATVVVAEGAFSMRSSGGSGGITVEGPNGTQTWNWHVEASGFTWTKERGQQLETYFRSGLNDSGACYVINREAIAEARTDKALEKEGLQAEQDTGPSLLRPDLKLICTLTKFEDNSERREDTASASNWWSRIPIIGMWLSGRGRTSTQKGECEITVEIVDRSTGVTVATATGKGFAVGGSKSATVAGWQNAIFGQVGTTSTKSVDMTAAIQRAAIRAINDVVAKIPAGYFRHELQLGVPAATPTVGAAPATPR